MFLNNNNNRKQLKAVLKMHIKLQKTKENITNKILQKVLKHYKKIIKVQKN